MRRRDRVLGGAAAEALRERRREALVGRLHRDGEHRPQLLDECGRLGGLLAVLAAQRQRQADDDDLRLVLGDEPRDLREPGLGRRLANDPDRAREGPARVGDGDPVRAAP